MPCHWRFSGRLETAQRYADGVVLALFIILLLLFVVLPVIGLALWAVLTTVVVGLIIGGLGRLLVPGNQPIGLLATILSGLCGSIVGGFIGQHVLGVGRFGTVLIEIAFAAAIVALVKSSRTRRVGSSGI
jgi:uncharacterized membrane protein YeaQ/YmgE (transglycosylase-associated protein family)